MRECGRRAGLVEALGAASRTCIHPFKSTAGSREKRGSPREQHKALFPNIKAKSRCSIQSLLTKKQKRDTNVEMFTCLLPRHMATWPGRASACLTFILQRKKRTQKGAGKQRKGNGLGLVFFLFNMPTSRLIFSYTSLGVVVFSATIHVIKKRRGSKRRGRRGQRESETSVDKNDSPLIPNLLWQPPFPHDQRIDAGVCGCV